MNKNLKSFLDFKTKQAIRLHGIDPLNREAVATLVKANLKNWVAEAVAAGC